MLYQIFHKTQENRDQYSTNQFPSLRNVNLLFDLNERYPNSVVNKTIERIQLRVHHQLFCYRKSNQIKAKFRANFYTV